VLDEGRLVHLATAARTEPVDTTAAGDAFNAAYVHARLAGARPVAAARHGHALAAIVIQHPGAIAPRSAMAAMPAIT
jgi:2-dehydro-3-deoxygluconokinase